MEETWCEILKLLSLLYTAFLLSALLAEQLVAMGRKSTRKSTTEPSRRPPRESTRRSTEESIRTATRKPTESKASQPKLVVEDSSIPPLPAAASSSTEHEHQSPPSPEIHPQPLPPPEEERVTENEDPVAVTSPTPPPQPEIHPRTVPPPKEERMVENKDPVTSRALLLPPEEHPNISSPPKKDERAAENQNKNPVVTLPALPPPPHPPPQWRWRCHECGRKYPLACTRRCFHCGHQYCIPDRRKRGSRRRKRWDDWDQPVCTHRFDYPGWAAWGTYRRTVAAIRKEAQVYPEQSSQNNKKRKRTHDEDEEAADYDVFATWELRPERRRAPGLESWRLRLRVERDQVARRKEDMYVLGKLSCFVHCDFPSECRHARHTAFERWLQDADDLAARE